MDTVNPLRGCLTKCITPKEGHTYGAQLQGKRYTTLQPLNHCLSKSIPCPTTASANRSSLCASPARILLPITPPYHRPSADALHTVALNFFFVHNEHAVGLNHSPEKDHTSYSTTDILGIRRTNQYPTALPHQTDKDFGYIWQLTGMPYDTASRHTTRCNQLKLPPPASIG